jgi:hypothetical protein
MLDAPFVVVLAFASLARAETPLNPGMSGGLPGLDLDD